MTVTEITASRESELVLIPPPAAYLTMNKHLTREHHARLESEWLNAAYIAACAALGRSPELRARPRAAVTMTLPFRAKRTRDPHNFHPTLKPIIDGFVRAGVWPDDNPEWVRTYEPSLLVSPTETDVRILLNYGPWDGEA